MTDIIADALAHAIVVAEVDDPSRARWLQRATRHGEVVRLVRGIYVPREVIERLDPGDRELLRAVAAATRGRVRQPLCGISAARVWGVPILEDQFSPEVIALGWDDRATRRASDLRYWATPDDGYRIVEHRGARVTDLPRTIAELGVRSSFARTVAAIDWAIRVRRRGGAAATTLEEIRAAADALALVRGRARLERALAFADGRSESPGESWMRTLIHQLGFEVPDLQHEYRLADGRRFRSDFRWPSIHLAGEFDGRLKYRAGEAWGGRTAEQVVIEEKEREDAIRATGDGMLRCVRDDLRDPRRLRHKLEAADVPRRAPRARFAPEATVRTS
ncbi:hypothetical protein [Microcella sp.]|uniref:hypothetical protein n=1 Tax=Microcella sp. TaxID=1913979 RepID=UPI00255D5201|nr:hypothetical protein [Microcella sp.]MBX9471814.1 hypothetical protein [Microcella sp.]